MAQDHGRDFAQVRQADFFRPAQGRDGARGAQKGELGAQAVGAQFLAQRGALVQHVVTHFEALQRAAGFEDVFAQFQVLSFPLGAKTGGVALERIAPLDDLHAQSQVLRGAHFYRQAKTVQQLRAQFAFFGVATAHQHKAGGVAHAQALALHQVLAGCGHVNQQIDQMVFQQIDLVDVQKAPVGLRQQAGRKFLHALRQGFFQIERADHAVFGCAQRQIHHRDRALQGREFLA